MTYPRAHTVSRHFSRVYHCTSRCVRRAWLCGEDEVSGQSFDHRKQWIEERLLELTQIFAVELYGYAVMSNHYHIVVRTRPEHVHMWSDLEVVSRWLQLCSVPNEEARDALQSAALQNSARICELRERLGDLSWFMRYINEPIARRANREDECTGRFWQGRFHCGLLLDELSIAAAIAYADLNPSARRPGQRPAAGAPYFARPPTASPGGPGPGACPAPFNRS